MADITKGIKYIKINRLDSNGEDYGALIQNANNLTINYPDVGSIQYDILTTQPQGNYYLLGVITQPITSSTFSYLLTSRSVNFSPENINFLNSDDNAIFNNATTPQYSNIYQDIDYSTGLVPTNFELLASGNADYAPVQDSNYTATGWANSRYKGSRVSSTDFNV
jgi:hypothetical protein